MISAVQVFGLKRVAGDPVFSWIADAFLFHFGSVKSGNSKESLKNTCVHLLEAELILVALFLKLEAKCLLSCFSSR